MAVPRALALRQASHAYVSRCGSTYDNDGHRRVPHEPSTPTRHVNTHPAPLHPVLACHAWMGATHILPSTRTRHTMTYRVYKMNSSLWVSNAPGRARASSAVRRVPVLMLASLHATLCMPSACPPPLTHADHAAYHALATFPHGSSLTISARPLLSTSPPPLASSARIPPCSLAPPCSMPLCIGMPRLWRASPSLHLTPSHLSPLCARVPRPFLISREAASLRLCVSPPLAFPLPQLTAAPATLAGGVKAVASESPQSPSPSSA